MDDSQCKLLPGEKQRHPKKDFGTTSYKKPGPPTPSKNGGRLSLQGGDVLPMREHNGRTSTTPKKVTYSTLTSLTDCRITQGVFRVRPVGCARFLKGFETVAPTSGKTSR